MDPHPAPPPHPIVAAVERQHTRIAENLARAAAHLRRTEALLRASVAEHPAGSGRPLPEDAGRRGAEAPYLLLVDPAPAPRTALAYLLRDQGYTVREAAAAHELPGPADPLPALVLLDPGPHLAGALATLRAIRSRSGPRTIPVVLLGSTAAGDERDLAAVCADCLSKPCRPDDVFAAVERIVGPPPQHGAAAGHGPRMRRTGVHP